jgi:hypothetical protein
MPQLIPLSNYDTLRNEAILTFRRAKNINDNIDIHQEKAIMGIKGAIAEQSSRLGQHNIEERFKQRAHEKDLIEKNAFDITTTAKFESERSLIETEARYSLALVDKIFLDYIRTILCHFSLPKEVSEDFSQKDIASTNAWPDYLLAIQAHKDKLNALRPVDPEIKWDGVVRESELASEYANHPKDYQASLIDDYANPNLEMQDFIDPD